MRNARNSGVRTPRGQYTTYPPRRMAPAMYTTRGKTISRRGTSTGDVLQRLTLRCVWHLFVHHTAPPTAFLHQHGIWTTLEFPQCPEAWVKQCLSKPFYHIWQELHGA